MTHDEFEKLIEGTTKRILSLDRIGGVPETDAEVGLKAVTIEDILCEAFKPLFQDAQPRPAPPPKQSPTLPGGNQKYRSSFYMQGRGSGGAHA